MVYCWQYNSHYWTKKEYNEVAWSVFRASRKALDPSEPPSYIKIDNKILQRLGTSHGCIPLHPWHIALISLGGLLLLDLIIGLLVLLARALSKGGSRSKV
jgi:hypothetical protein